MTVATFVMSAGDSDAMDRISAALPQAQRRILVNSLVTSEHSGERVLINDAFANESSVQAMMAGISPLVEDCGPFRYMTALGKDVARYLNQTGMWDLPIPAPEVPRFQEPPESEDMHEEIDSYL